MASIRSITTTNFGPLLLPSITGRDVSALVHMRFPVARDLCFIMRTLTIREQMGLPIFEKKMIVVSVLIRMMPTFSLRHILSIGSVNRMVGIIREVEDIYNALEGIA